VIHILTDRHGDGFRGVQNLFVGQTTVVADSRKKTLTNWQTNGIIGESKMDVCFWEEVDDGDCYESSCNKKGFQFNDGNPQDNGFEFCPYCGKKLIVKKPIFDEVDI